MSNSEPPMPLRWIHATTGLDWDALSALYQAAPLGSKSPEGLRTVFGNSRYGCVVYDGEHLVGAGRVLADGLDCAYVCDIAVHPSHQGSGLGRAIVNYLLAQSQGHKKIILYAVPGKEPYYRRFGFRRMKTAMAIFMQPDDAAARGYIDD
nr:GNAT family N-acetyltransferase [uncultured Rhodoferax sp.]